MEAPCSCSDCEFETRYRLCDCDSCNERRRKGRGRFGKYGVISMKDLPRKREEFQLWLIEVCKRSPESLSGNDEMMLFRKYIEDYNTATLPAKKYYRKGKKRKLNFDDEEMRRHEMKRARDEEKAKEIDEMYENLKKDSQVVQAMRRQQELRVEMDYLFKTGKVEAAREIQQLLRAEKQVESRVQDSVYDD